MLNVQINRKIRYEDKVAYLFLIAVVTFAHRPPYILPPQIPQVLLHGT